MSKLQEVTEPAKHKSGPTPTSRRSEAYLHLVELRKHVIICSILKKYDASMLGMQPIASMY
jgi:hypothetical protein